MSDKYFVDTNILVYANAAAAGDKHARAQALVEDLWLIQVAETAGAAFSIQKTFQAGRDTAR